MNKLLLIIITLTCVSTLNAQLVLSADGAGTTYELITSKLAPGYNPVEVPDCGHASFGRHIDEVFDATLNTNVFRFFIHTHEDNDRCINVDRQRNEIKTYDQSPDSLKGVEGETVEFTWKFKLDAGFQSSSSFTHIHQLKAVGGTEDDMPLITLTTRKGSSNDKLQLRYAANLSQSTIHEVDLTPFKGVWVKVVETVTYGEIGSGTYTINILRNSDNASLMSYSNTNIRMWKTNADFIRPKWGIYRSLLDSTNLRDEEVLFADFTIEEIDIILPVELLSFTATPNDKTVALNWVTLSEKNNAFFTIEKLNFKNWETIGRIEGAGNTIEKQSYTFIDKSPAIGQNYYRLKQTDFDGTTTYSEIVMVEILSVLSPFLVFPNPATDLLQVSGTIISNQSIDILDIFGTVLYKNVNHNKLDEKTISIDISFLESGVYVLKIDAKPNLFIKQ